MRANADQRAILAALLAQHPRMIEVSSVLTLDGVERPNEALRTLVQDGLAVRLGDIVGATRAAIRYEELRPLG
jgi:hypothetical protein